MTVRSDRRLAGLVSTREAADLLGVGRGKVQYAQRTGAIPLPRRGWGDAGSKYYREQELPKLADALGIDLPPPDVPPAFAEVFSGEGLFRAALEPGGWRSVYAADKCRTKAAGYAARWGDRTHVVDVRDSAEVAERLAAVGPIGLLTAGFPCTDASSAGRGRGIVGAGTSAVFGLADVLRRLDRRPPLVLLENVTGLVTRRGGEDFRVLLRLFSELGYGVDAFVLSADRFVPQSRRRLYVVCAAPHLRSDRETAFPGPGPLRPAYLLEAMKRCEPAGGWLNLELPEPPERTVRLQDLIDLSDGASWWPEREAAELLATCKTEHAARLREMAGDPDAWVGTAFRRTPREKVPGRSKRLEVRFDGVAGCLLRSSGGGLQFVVVAGGGRIRIRPMSAAEYAALQGVEHLPGRGENASRAAYGDAVCVPAIRWIDREVLTPLRNGELRA